MAFKYYTKEWLDEFKRRTETDEEYKKKAKDHNYTAQYLLTDCPTGTDRVGTITYDKGVIVNYKLDEKPAPSDFRELPFDDKTCFMKVGGSYEAYAKLNRKEMTAMQALMQKIYKIDGPMPKIMSLMAGITAQAEIMASIPTDY